MNTNDIHITLPASKSLSNRWLILNYLMGNHFRLRNLSTSDDTVLLRKLLAQLQSKSSNVYDCRNAGTVVRFITALLAITPGTHIVTGDERLQQRPIADLVESLNNMGCNIRYSLHQNHLPLKIEGTIPRRKMAFVDASKSSQFASALLLIAPALPNGMTLTITSRILSRPYIHMTCDVLRQAGIDFKVDTNSRVISVAPFGENKPLNNVVNIEQDWSSASYFYEMAAMFPQLRLRLNGLTLESSQGDKELATIYNSLGVTTYQVHSPYKKNSASLRIQVNKSFEDKFNYNFHNCPDLLPAVAVTCAYLGINATFSGVQLLRLKESDRLMAIINEINAMQGKVFLKSDGSLAIRTAKLKPSGMVHTYNDHRIAMAFAPLTLVYPELEIETPEVVSKSFPEFWNQLELIRQQFNHE